MSAVSSFDAHQLTATIRFIQGYRYLDRCGEALVRLEDELAEGWITSEVSPKSGLIKNDELGLTATFNSESMTVNQSEFISFDHFIDQACLVFSVLSRTFEIKRINLPSLRVIFQKGFKGDDLDEASRYMMGLSLGTPHPQLNQLLGGKAQAIDLVMVTEDDLVWSDLPVHRRRRFSTQVVRQEKQLPFDERIMRRAKHLPERQRAAISGLMKLRKQHPESATVAAQLDVEEAFETEFVAQEFDLHGFLGQSWQWAESVREAIPRLRQGGK